MNFKCTAPLPLRHRFHCPIRVTLNACTNPIRVMPVVINGLDYPHSNRPFSHNIRHICHPLCPTEPFPSRSCHAFLIITKPFPRSGSVRNFQSSVTSLSSWPSQCQTATSRLTFLLNVLWTFVQFLNFKILLTIIALRILGQDFGTEILGQIKYH